MTAALLPAPDSLPAGLVALPHWLAWRAVERGGRVTKVPYSPATGRLASSTDPKTWTRYEQAAAFAAQGQYDGIGFVFTETPYVGIDLDHCIDVASGEVAPWALEIVERFASYTEVSPSGGGLHIFVRGSLPPGGRRSGPIEVYETGRYFTVTGQTFGEATEIAERSAELATWHAATFRPPEPEHPPTPPAGPVPLDDAALLERMFSSASGADIRALWHGDRSAHGGDDSAADLALCNHLAFWTDRDAGRIDRLFRQSGLMRAKWDARRGKATYGQRTIAEAISGTPEGYGGPALSVDASKPAQNGTVKGIETISAPLLMVQQFAEPRYAVPGLLPEGLCILAGRPKLGKSWLGLGLALSVASGDPALGMVEVEQGDVLLMALEDGRRRLQRRLSELLNDTPAPQRLTLATKWPKLNEGGLTALQEWLAVHPEARLVVVDTFKRIRPDEKRGVGIYGQDYEAVQPLADLAHDFSISIVLVMHTRKMDADDPLDLISGSLGLSGAADGALVMKRIRGQQDALLSVIDRDAEESEKALRWNIATGGWLLLGDAEEYKRSRQRNEILALLHDVGSMTPKDVADYLQKPRGSVRWLMTSMQQAGLLINAGGIYMPRAARPADIPSFIEDKQANSTSTANSTNSTNRERVSE